MINTKALRYLPEGFHNNFLKLLSHLVPKVGDFVAENLSNSNTFEGDLLLISTMNEEYGPSK